MHLYNAFNPSSQHYEESAKKRGVPLPSKPVLFMKASTCLANPGDDVWMPSLEHGNTLDWEVELAIVIGKKCRNVTPENALKFVAGYTVRLPMSIGQCGICVYTALVSIWPSCLCDMTLLAILLPCVH